MAESTPHEASLQAREMYRAISERYEPSDEITEHTHLMSTSEIMERLNSSFPGIALTGDSTFQMMQELGFRQIENDTLEFLWALKKR